MRACARVRGAMRTFLARRLFRGHPGSEGGHALTGGLHFPEFCLAAVHKRLRNLQRRRAYTAALVTRPGPTRATGPDTIGRPSASTPRRARVHRPTRARIRRTTAPGTGLAPASAPRCYSYASAGSVRQRRVERCLPLPPPSPSGTPTLESSPNHSEPMAGRGEGGVERFANNRTKR